MFSPRTGKPLVFCLVFAFAAFAANDSAGPFARILHHAAVAHGGLQKPQTLAKRASLEWRQVASTHYTFNSIRSIDTTTWLLSMRDTSCYDAGGNRILYKTSMPRTDGALDSVSWIDSSVYIAGNISEQYSIYPNDASSNNNSRTVVEYFNGGTTLVLTASQWDKLSQSWQINRLDTLVFSKPAEHFTGLDSMVNVLRNLITFSVHEADPMTGNWEYSGRMARIDAECTATTLVMEVVANDTETGETFEKAMFTFRSSEWTDLNLATSTFQEKASAQAPYVNYGKEEYTLAANGYLTGDLYYDWDTTSNSWVGSYGTIEAPDSRGNDTFSIGLSYGGGVKSWDTTSWGRSALTYDVNNNLLEAIAFQYYGGAWVVQAKADYAYAQINVPVVRAPAPCRPARISYAMTPAGIRFFADAITGIDVYNSAGRQVLAARQPAAPSLTIDCSKARPSPGVYVARLINKASSPTSVRFTVR